MAGGNVIFPSNYYLDGENAKCKGQQLENII